MKPAHSRVFADTRDVMFQDTLSAAFAIAQHIADMAVAVIRGINADPREYFDIKDGKVELYPDAVWLVAHKLQLNIGMMDEERLEEAVKHYMPHCLASSKIGKTRRTRFSQDEFGRDVSKYYNPPNSWSPPVKGKPATGRLKSDPRAKALPPHVTEYQPGQTALLARGLYRVTISPEQRAKMHNPVCAECQKPGVTTLIVKFGGHRLLYCNQCRKQYYPNLKIEKE